MINQRYQYFSDEISGNYTKYGHSDTNISTLFNNLFYPIPPAHPQNLQVGYP
jgi:hypothetical protein